MGPTVAVDVAHNNNVADGRWDPLMRLLAKDGYRIKLSRTKLTAAALKGMDILVIANPLSNDNRTNRALPTFPAFEVSEIEAIEQWVKTGGSLLLLAGHMPWPGATEQLAERFDVFFQNGFAFAQDAETGQLMMSREADVKGLSRCSLLDHAITRGRSEQERLTVIECGGMLNAFRLREGGTARPFILVEGRWLLLFPPKPFDFSDATPRIRADGLAIAASATPGTGRVVLFGINAALLTMDPSRREPYGINDPKVDNAQLVLNAFRWLSKVLPVK